MAAAVTSRLSAALCRQFQRVVTVSSFTQAHYAAQTISKFQSCQQRAPVYSRALHTSCVRKGLDEFFDLPENWGEPTVKSGAPWTAKQLRTKSNEDLHKLWYVLLKEKNMLLTIEQEAKRQCLQMPSPERVKKVERSMKRLDTVVQERADSLRLLQTGQEKARPGAWRKNVFGKTIWYKFREHPIPWHLNTRYKRKRFYEPLHVTPYTRLSLEKHLKSKVRKERREKRRHKELAEIFPKKTAVA
ncbi:39S ribosomal protein L47, mitochondrial [Triplophysa tibetana]|uniref:Large ribosomal subunit protein uL29m n=1 Tax=Triplophysa tibetana TaxID=1572043 RepID=A0A5A9NTS3_9TELE|nr:39S ribosomal protein L47, mitochondrial [Triplophysa tibetana]